MMFSKQDYIEKIKQFINENNKKGYSTLKISYSNVIELQKQRIKLLGEFEVSKQITKEKQEKLKILSFKLNTWLRICINELFNHYSRLLEEHGNIKQKIKQTKNHAETTTTNINSTLKKIQKQEKTIDQIIIQEKKVISHLTQILKETEHEMNTGIPSLFLYHKTPKGSNASTNQQSSSLPTPSSKQSLSSTPSINPLKTESNPSAPITDESVFDDPVLALSRKVTSPIPLPSQSPFFETFELLDNKNANDTLKQIPLPDVPILDQPTQNEEDDIAIPSPTPTVKDITNAVQSIPLPDTNIQETSGSQETSEVKHDAKEINILRLEMLKELTYLRRILRGKL